MRAERVSYWEVIFSHGKCESIFIYIRWKILDVVNVDDHVLCDGE